MKKLIALLLTLVMVLSFAACAKTEAPAEDTTEATEENTTETTTEATEESTTEATEAIEGNKDKLVYGYSLGTESIDQTTDPSGIDAEASIANGAIIIYKDTNNSTNDFHLRSRASLKK